MTKEIIRFVSVAGVQVIIIIESSGLGDQHIVSVSPALTKTYLTNILRK